MDTYQKLVRYALENHADKKMLGHRKLLEDGTLANEYTWETYAEVGRLGTHLGSGIINKDLIAEKAQYQDYKLKFVAV